MRPEDLGPQIQNHKEAGKMYLDGKGPDYMICVCKKKTLGEVQEFIRANRITDLKTLCEKADIGNKCGACREMLEELLQQEAKNC